MKFTHLHVHSQFSILDSTSSVKGLVDRAAQFGMESLALTDQGNLFGAVDFAKACRGKKIKPIIGCELYVAPVSRHEKKKLGGLRPGYPIVLLAKDAVGYKNLCKLSSIAHMEGFYYTPRIDKELLKKYSEGLVCLSGPMKGKIAELILAGNEEGLKEEISFMKELFGEDFYLEVTRHRMSEELMRSDGMDRESWLLQEALEFQKKIEKVGNRLVELSKEFGVELVAANDTRYMGREDWRAHEILMNVSSGEPIEILERDAAGKVKGRSLNPKRKVMFTHEHDFKSIEAMEALFADLPEAIANSSKIAEKCSFMFDFSAKFYPVFVPPELEGKKFTSKERKSAVESFMRNLCEKGIAERYDEKALAKVAETVKGKDPMAVVRARVDYELNLIISKGLCDYLLIVYDFIAWAKGKGIPVGPGRGSGAGSIVCYLTGITDIEPLRFNLFFERFINPERVSYPDIDVDICMDRRSEVIDYTIEKYGSDKVAQIITFGTMKAKMAVKDVGRVLNVPLATVNELAKLIPEDPNMTLKKALEMDPDLKGRYDSDEETKRLIDLAKVLEGSVRNTGIHAAGLIVSADPLMEHIPVCTAKDANMMVTQYAMKPVEAVGMLKIDFLGLKTLTAIQHATDALKEQEGVEINWASLPLEDGPTFDLLNQGKTLGLFQLESGGMQELAKQLHIDRFEEIIAVGALYRPGPMEMIPSFIKRKHGKEEIEIDHPLMEEILQETYGIMVYQEQVMMIAQRLAGYSLGAGDVLRKAMGKKDREEMERQREKFREGAIANGIDEATAITIFEKIEKFASYGFNKSHATAYGYMSYVTAFLKANYPMHWMAALMTTDQHDLSKVTKIIRECQAMGIAILPPDVNESGVTFVATKKGIRFALSAVKGVGEGVIEQILIERKENGPFASLYDLVNRISTQKVGKKMLEVLIEVGAFDFTGWSRAQLLATLDPIFSEVQKAQKEEQKGELNFFSMIEEEGERFQTPPDVPPLHKMEVLKREKELLGFYLTGHPLDNAEKTLRRLSCVSLDKIEALDVGSVFRVGFVIESVATKLAARSGRRFAILTIGDIHARFELPIWPELFESKGHLLRENGLIYAVLQVEKDEDGRVRLQCKWLDDLTKVGEQMVAECDAAFDKARMQVKMARFKKEAPKKKEEAKEKMVEKVTLKLEADEVRLSNILELKQCFADNAGSSEVEIEFLSGEKTHARLHVSASSGVTPSDAFKNSLDAFPFVVAVSIDKTVNTG